MAWLQACKAELVKQQRIETLDAEIEDLIIDDSSIEYEILNKCEFSTLIQETVCFVNSFLSKSSAIASPENITSAASATVQKQAACSSTKVKLPKFFLPSFAGDATQWISFWDSFASAIHDNNDLNNIDKFQYLRSCLQGSAAETVGGITTYKRKLQRGGEIVTSSVCKQTDHNIQTHKHPNGVKSDFKE